MQDILARGGGNGPPPPFLLLAMGAFAILRGLTWLLSGEIISRKRGGGIEFTANSDEDPGFFYISIILVVAIGIVAIRAAFTTAPHTPSAHAQPVDRPTAK